jgi:hypothetical protein
MNRIFHAVALALLLASCSSQKTSKRDSLGGQPMSQRIANSMKRMQDPHDRSAFDKSMQASLGGNKSAGWLSRQKHSVGDYNGVKSFQAAQSFKTQAFNGGDMTSRLGTQAFNQREKQPSFADDTFKTTENPFSQKMSRDDTRSFSGANDVFKTKANREGLKEQKKDNTPKFIELDEKERRSAYTEDEVRRLLGRD